MNDTLKTWIPEGIGETNVVFEVGQLQKHLSQIPDPRKARGIRYSLPVLLSLLVLAKLCGEDKLSGMAEWLRLREEQLTEWLGLERRTLPHVTTYSRVLAELDLDHVETVLGEFFQKQNITGVVSLDGKTLRGTIPAGQTHGTHLLAAYAVERGVVLHQMDVATKTNEITVAPQLISRLDLRNCIVTGDALLTQHTICDAIQTAGGNYIFPVKANQATLQQAIAETFLPPLRSYHRTWLTADQTHICQSGRVEWRILTATSLLNDYVHYLGWSHVQQVFRLQHKATQRLSYDVVFGITSLTAQQATPADLLRITQQHWHIENRLHYVRDVSLGEDACQVRNPHIQHSLASLNNLALGLIRLATDFPYIPQARRYLAANLADACQLIC